jgi:Family of unknown function (DUF6492)
MKSSSPDEITTANIDQLICVCCIRDAQTWKIASAYIVRNIAAKHYKVYVPDVEIQLFQAISATPFEIIGESIYTKDFAQEIRERLSKSVSGQFGWYLQQLLKIAAVKNCKPADTVLIWDADTIPLRSLSFVDGRGRLQYYQGREYHHPYFETIMRLLRLSKKVRFSFIAQCFVTKASWVQEFCAQIEAKHHKSWVAALLDAINFKEGNSFSEYETLGTFISHYHGDEVVYMDRKWLRLGNSSIGHPAFLTPRLIASELAEYDFASFEKWDKAKPYFLRVSIPYFFNVYLPSLFSKSR